MAEVWKPNIYRVIRADGSYVSGTARMLSHGTPYSANYIRKIADTKTITQYGDRVVTVEHNAGKLLVPPVVLIAENPADDPIIGPAEEIAALTGLTQNRIRELARTGGSSRAGWTVRPATEEEIRRVE